MNPSLLLPVVVYEIIHPAYLHIARRCPRRFTETEIGHDFGLNERPNSFGRVIKIGNGRVIKMCEIPGVNQDQGTGSIRCGVGAGSASAFGAAQHNGPSWRYMGGAGLGDRSRQRPSPSATKEVFQCSV
ncbi:hypothetical protein RHA1_ro00715 [Rhodococcus jostii RHA1]|uniref:Uncharacterized protein n=1 Tax=Rhodococcus jostii (strain RHA1) TaxID=101510 RepID=Q0SIT6_RHOJR|nr:hypothetical protein RHA1_ro00715 [Rhodococcus jostii RHA1]